MRDMVIVFILVSTIIVGVLAGTAWAIVYLLTVLAVLATIIQCSWNVLESIDEMKKVKEKEEKPLENKEG